MLLELILKPLWWFLNFLLGLIPDTAMSFPAWYDNFVLLLRKGLSIFPPDVWAICIGCIVFWLGVHMTWAVIEWIYKKIPGVS